MESNEDDVFARALAAGRIVTEGGKLRMVPRYVSDGVALRLIADIAEGSATANSLPNIARIAREAVGKTTAKRRPETAQTSEADIDNKWTPGPWMVVPARDGDDVNIAAPHPPGREHLTSAHPGGFAVACVWALWGCDGGQAVTVANAHLIAAAPEMAKLLQAASHALRSYQYGNSATELAQGCADQIDALLAKARAESPASS